MTESGLNPVARLRRVGLMVLLAGVVIGGLIYFVAPTGTSTDENSLSSQYYKRDEDDAQRLWGNSGSAVLWFTRSLNQPSTYAVGVIAVSVVFALGCFYVASRREQGGEGR